jgi:hypothetical protein
MYLEQCCETSEEVSWQVRMAGREGSPGEVAFEPILEDEEQHQNMGRAWEQF